MIMSIILQCRYKSCSKRLIDPITLPCCGKTICNWHLSNLYLNNEQTKMKCPCCSSVNDTPIGGIKVNEVLSILLYQNQEGVQNPTKQLCNQLLESIQVLKVLQRDPLTYIDQYLQNIKNGIDLEREEIKLQIDEYYDELFKKYNKIEKQLKDNYPESDLNNLTECISSFEREHESYVEQSNRFTIDDSVWKKLDKCIRYTNEKVNNQIRNIQSRLTNCRHVRFDKGELDIQKLGKLVDSNFDEASFMGLFGNFENEINMVDLVNGQILKTFKGHQDEIIDVLLLEENKFVSFSQDNTIKVWDKNSGKCLRSINFEYQDTLTSFARLTSSKFVTGTDRGCIFIWDLDKEYDSPIKKINAHSSRVNLIVPCLSGFFSTSGDRVIKSWTTSAQYERQINNFDLIGHWDWISHMKLIDCKTLLSSSLDGYILKWDLDTRVSTFVISDREGIILFEVTPDLREFSYISKIGSGFCVKLSRDGVLLNKVEFGNELMNICIFKYLSINKIIYLSDFDDIEIRDGRYFDVIRKFPKHNVSYKMLSLIGRQS